MNGEMTLQLWPSTARRVAVGALLLCLLQAACGADATIAGPCDLAACDDGLACTNDGCAKDGSCIHTARTGACDDGNACTNGDSCQGTVCAGATTDCNDTFPCTQDACDKAKGCVHIAGDITACEDGNLCTDDKCDPAAGCVHAPNAATCTDGSLCTLNDACSGGACLPGATTVGCDDKNPCTDDACAPATGACSHLANKAPCDDGNPCTNGDVCAAAACSAPLDCTCAVAAGQKLPAEDCDTPGDDNCNGIVNDVSVCGASVYKFSSAPECGAVCYYDEGHNVAVNGPGAATNNAGFDTFAIGDLFDGVRGVDDWAANLGKGAGAEWVAWTAPLQILTVQFAKPRDVALVHLGLNNKKDGSVSQPPEVQIRLSDDGVKWSALASFKVGETQPAIPAGKRGDIALTFPTQTARFVEIRFLTPGSWTFVDEIDFD